MHLLGATVEGGEPTRVAVTLAKIWNQHLLIQFYKSACLVTLKQTFRFHNGKEFLDQWINYQILTKHSVSYS